MALSPDEIRRGVVVLVRLPDDKARPAVIVRANLLAGLPYATILPLTTELRPDVDFRIAVEPSKENGLRETSQVMVDWPQTVRAKSMGTMIGRLDDATMRVVTEQLAVVLGIGGGDSEADLLMDALSDALRPDKKIDPS
jgi:mRNA interferase MazF